MVRDCPNCGANVRYDGDGDFARCRFCGTQIEIPRADERRRTRRVVELEREWTTDRDLRQKRLREIEAELDVRS
jgi:tRNA(Ile2) C34 agmatinyltransferase TiaS